MHLVTTISDHRARCAVIFRHIMLFSVVESSIKLNRRQLYEAIICVNGILGRSSAFLMLLNDLGLLYFLVPLLYRCTRFRAR